MASRYRPFRCMDAGIFFFMALRDQPYMPLYIKDFLTDEKLNECSASAQGVYIKIMCLLHKSETYGGILLKQKFKQSENQITNFAQLFARLLPFNVHEIESALKELLEAKVMYFDGDFLWQKRMKKDGEISEIRSEAGSKGGKKSQQKDVNFDSNFGKAKSKAKTKQNHANANDIVIDNEIDNEIVISKKNKLEIKREINSDWPDEKKREYVLHHYPSVLKMQKPLTEEQLMRLVEEFGRDAVHKKMEALENKKDAVKKYKSAFLTLRSWCRDFPDISHEAKKQSNKEKIKEAMEILQSGQSLIPEFK